MRMVAVIDQNRCKGCGECYRNCPFGAIIPRGDRYEVDPSLCRGCGVCERVCPVGAISLQPVTSPGISPSGPGDIGFMTSFWPGMGRMARGSRGRGGYGRGGWGRGRGRGRGGYGRGGWPWGGGFGPGGIGPMQPIQGNPQAELEMLKQYAQELKRRLKEINEKIRKLENK